MAELLLGPSIALGLAIGVYEALIIHRDVSIPTHRFGHMVHALLLSILFVFVSMNVEFVYELVPAITSIPLLGIPLLAQIAVGLIAAIKIHAISRVLKSSIGATTGMGETWFHSLLIGALIVAAPYIYPVVAPLLPPWLNF